MPLAAVSGTTHAQVNQAVASALNDFSGSLPAPLAFAIPAMPTPQPACIQGLALRSSMDLSNVAGGVISPLAQSSIPPWSSVVPTTNAANLPGSPETSRFLDADQSMDDSAPIYDPTCGDTHTPAFNEFEVFNLIQSINLLSTMTGLPANGIGSTEISKPWIGVRELFDLARRQQKLLDSTCARAMKYKKATSNEKGYDANDWRSFMAETVESAQDTLNRTTKKVAQIWEVLRGMPKEQALLALRFGEYGLHGLCDIVAATLEADEHIYAWPDSRKYANHHIGNTSARGIWELLLDLKDMIADRRYEPEAVQLIRHSITAHEAMLTHRLNTKMRLVSQKASLV